MKYMRMSLFLVFLSALNVSAIIDIQGGVWLLSTLGGTNTTVAETLTRIENDAKNGNFKEAINKSKEFRAENDISDYYLTNGELLPLTLEVMEFYYKYGKDIKNPQVEKELPPIIKKYAKEAKGKQWYAYRYALQYLEFHYRRAGDTNNMIRAMKDIVSYDVYDKYQLERLLRYAGTYPNKAEEIRRYWKELSNSDVKNNAETELVYIFDTGLPKEEKFKLINEWFAKNTLAIYRVMQTAIERSGEFVIKEYPEKKIAFAETLKLLALRQPPVSERLPVLALIKNALSDKELAAGATSKPRDEELSAASLEKTLSGNGSDWENMCESVAFIWSEHSNQRYKGNLSLEQTISALNKAGKLKEKLQDPNDDLSDIEEYKDLIKIPDIAGQIYHLAEKLFWTGQYGKAKTCFEFLISEDNKDEFGVGASHFFLGRMAKDLPPDIMSFSNREERHRYALEHLLKANTYATCLTYISYSYIMAAEIFHEMGLNHPALALLLIDVPSIDWNSVKAMRHTAAARYCFLMEDSTNLTRHVQEALRYSKEDDPGYQVLEEYHGRINPELWKYCADKLFTSEDRNKAIVSALDDEKAQAWREELFNALLHIWPKPPEMPEGMATNRVLNNNIFPFRIDEELSSLIRKQKEASEGKDEE